ncbi:MAG: lipopolysaccharide biosynthesis protein [Gemmatimonadaceae bacterium]
MKLLDRRRISRNVAATLVQVFVTGIVFFLLYRYLYHRLGIAQIGVWSIVLATTSVSRIGDLGLSAAVVRYVAKSLANGDQVRAAQVIDTVAIALALLMAAVLVVAMPAFESGLEFFVPFPNADLAKSILPYALISFWCATIASVSLGGLDGCQRIDLRTGLTALSQIFYLGLTVIWVPKFGLKGVALAQTIQSLGLALAARLVLRGQLTSLSVLPTQLRLEVLRDLFRYGVNFQFISLMAALFDPITKGLLAKFGGLSSLGYYEMVNKLILQARSAIVEANRVVVPVVSILKERKPERVKELFLVTYRTIFFISIVFYACVGALMPSISLLWTGTFQIALVQFGLLLASGWFINTLIGPAYFANLGSGELRDNVTSHVIISSTTLIAGTLLGSLIGGVGVVLGAVLGISCGSVFLLWSYIKRGGLVWPAAIVPRGLLWLIILSAAATLVSNAYAYTFATQVSPLKVIVVGSMCSASVVVYGWFHPIRKDMLRWPKRRGTESVEEDID